jgi:hypothetical protein
MNDQTTERQPAYEGYAIIELMGHNTIAGHISEVTIAGAAMLRVDVPAVGEQAAFTKFVGASAIYGITPTTQEIAERAAQRLHVKPVSVYLVEPDSLAGEEREDSEEYEMDEEADNPF